MRPERLVEVFGLMRQTLEALYGSLASDSAGQDDAPDPATLAKCKPVRRLLHRVGVVHSKQPGKKTGEEVEEAVWCIAENMDLGVAEVAQVLMCFAGALPGRGTHGVCVASPECDECLVRDMCRHFARREPTIKDLPEMERPRERLLSMGDSVLSNTELLALLIGGGKESCTAVDLARMLLAKAGGLRELSGLTASELKETPGIGAAKAARLLAAFALAKRYATTRLEPGSQFGCSRDIFSHYQEEFGQEKREIFTCVFLDAKHRFMGEERISIGTLMASPVGPREVFRPAIRAAAQAVIFVHNHPSGDPSPSNDDLNTTRRLLDVGKTIGIRVLDHVIVGNNDYFSFADKGLL